jgi:signal transduction histidine kinase
MDVLQELSQSLLNLNSGQSLPAVLQRMLVQKTRELGALTEINRSIAASADRETLLWKIAADAKNILALDGVVIRLLDGGVLLRAAHAGSGQRARARVDKDNEESLCGMVVRENRAIIVTNVARAAELTPRYRNFLAGQGCRSVLCLPLRAADRVIGALVGLAENERAYQPDEIEALAALADQTAIAVEKSVLLDDGVRQSTEIRRINQEFEQERHAKAKFISTVSHELRTPLQVIIGYTDLLKEGIVGESKEEQARVLSTILQNAEMLDRLIANVLALTKAEVKQTVLDISIVEIEEVMEQIVRYARRIDPGQRLRFSSAAETELPPITTDAAKLQAILQNLVGNAWKFTPKGKIDVRVKNLPGRNRVEFSVADTGIGIEASEREKIFEEFYQSKQAQAINRTGVGLGLSIVKKYLALMQGEIRVDGAPGKGTTFTFTLPHSIT